MFCLVKPLKPKRNIQQYEIPNHPIISNRFLISDSNDGQSRDGTSQQPYGQGDMPHLHNTLRHPTAGDWTARGRWLPHLLRQQATGQGRYGGYDVRGQYVIMTSFLKIIVRCYMGPVYVYCVLYV